MNFDISQKNVGKNDSMVRGAVGALMLVVALMHHSLGAAIIGLALIATAYLRFCPAYTVAKFSTNTDPTPPAK